MAPPASSVPEALPRLVALAQILVLSLWLGAAVFVAAVVAPSAFAALPTRELAGALVGRVLPVLFIAGAVAGIIVLLLEATAPARARPSRRGARMVIMGMVILSCAIAQLGVAPRIETLRAGLSAPLASLPAGDPQRVAFGRLHMISVGWLGAAMLAAGAALVLTAYPLLRPGDAR